MGGDSDYGNEIVNRGGEYSYEHRCNSGGRYGTQGRRKTTVTEDKVENNDVNKIGNDV